MAVAKRSSSSVAYGSRTNTSVTVPAGAAAGDVITIALAVGNSAQVNPTTPTGWTLVKDVVYTAPDPWAVHMVMYAKAFVPGETSYTITHPSAASQAYTVAWTGVDVTAPLDVAAVSAFQNDNVTSGTNVATAPALTIVTAGAQGIIVRGSWDGNAITPPTGWTEAYDAPVLWVGEKPYPATGTTGTVAVPAGNGSSRSPWGIIHAALRPASDGNSYAATGAVASASTIAGAVTARMRASGGLNGQTVVSGSVTASRPVVGVVASGSTITGSVIARKPASGAVASSSTVSGAVIKTATVSGAVTSSSTVTGAVTSRRPTTAAITSGSNTTGEVTAALPVSGNVESSSTISGDMTAPGGLSGVISAVSAIAGAITARYPINGATGSTTTVTGQMDTVDGLTGTITAATDATGSVTANYQTAGNTASASAVHGQITALLTVMGTITATTTITGWVSNGGLPPLPDRLTLTGTMLELTITGTVPQYTLTGDMPALTLEAE